MNIIVEAQFFFNKHRVVKLHKKTFSVLLIFLAFLFVLPPLITRRFRNFIIPFL